MFLYFIWAWEQWYKDIKFYEPRSVREEIISGMTNACPGIHRQEEMTEVALSPSCRPYRESWSSHFSVRPDELCERWDRHELWKAHQGRALFLLTLMEAWFSLIIFNILKKDICQFNKYQMNCMPFTFKKEVAWVKKIWLVVLCDGRFGHYALFYWAAW